jgi:hypothetical protein
MRLCRRRHSLLRTCAALGIALVAASPLPALAQGPATIYATRFEEPAFVAGLPLIGQDGWEAPPPPPMSPLSSLAAVVSTDKPRQGRQSIAVWGGDMVTVEGPLAPYAAVGSYRKPLNHVVAPKRPVVRIEANLLLETDQPATEGESPDDDFFSMTLAARSGDGETLGEIGLSSSGHAVAYNFNAAPGAVPAFTAPIAFNEWHRVGVEVDFSGVEAVVLYYLDDELIGAMPTDSTSKVLLRGALVVYALPDGDGNERANYTARIDNFRVSALGIDD